MKRSKVVAPTGESTFHARRYSFAADLVALGANDIELMFQMRHRDANTSKTVYATARQEKAVYAPYRSQIHRLDDYLKVIAQMDGDRGKVALSLKD